MLFASTTNEQPDLPVDEHLAFSFSRLREKGLP
jgi:hypothetical protein